MICRRGRVDCLAGLVFILAGLICSPVWAFRFDPEPLLHQASVYLDQGKFLECVEAYEQVFTYAPSRDQKAAALVRMGDILSLFLEKKEQGLQMYEQAMRDFGASSATENAYFNAAMILYEQGQLSRSAKGFGNYLHFFPQGRRVGTADFMVRQIQDELAAPSPEPEKKTGEPSRIASPEIQIRVALEKGPVIRLGFSHGAHITWSGGKLDIDEPSLDIRTRQRKLLAGSSVLGRSCEIVPVDGMFVWKDRHYRGKAVLHADGDIVLLVNVLPMEAYLQGVVPKEMMASWEENALCAQAVAARTYALYLCSKSQDKPYDVAATTASQVYGGADAGSPRTDAAVKGTRGNVLMFDRVPALSYFHSHSGGMLEDPAQVWTTGMPYYRIQPDHISTDFHPLTWTARISAQTVSVALEKNGFHVGRIREITVAESSPSGRWTKVRIVTDSGDVEVKGNSLRIWLGAGKIKSTLGRITRQGNDFVFTGRGFGHGVGLSQWGAQGMARNGESYQTILAHYYPGTVIEKVY